MLSHIAQTGSRSRQPLLMTYRVLIMFPDGLTTQARALLDSASSTSFVSECLAQYLHLPCLHRQAQITGIGGLTHISRSVCCALQCGPMSPTAERLDVEAIVFPKVTSDLSCSPFPLTQSGTI